MNPFIKSTLTSLGLALLSTTLAQAIKVIEARQSNATQPVTDEALTPAVKVRGSNEVYSDLESLTELNQNKELSLDDVSLVVLRVDEATFNGERRATVNPRQIILSRTLEPYHVTPELLQKLQPTVIEAELIDSGEVGPTDTNTGTRPEANTESTTTPASQDSNSNSPSKVTDIVGGAKQVIDYFNSQEKFHKVRLLVEKVDTSIEIDVEGEVRQSSNTSSKSMISTVVNDNTLVTLVHLYQDNKYLITVGSTDLINHLTTLCFSNKILIQQVETINTVKGEFTPSEKWVH